MSEVQEQDAEGVMEVPQLNSVQRRILGVLVEKAKTTPQNYPLTLNSLTSGCNQKSNRAPKMELDSDDCLDELDALRKMGAVMEVHGDGRVAKYKHRVYDWLKVNSEEAAILAELLLRGPQTIGELRARASRMAKIPDLSTLQPILQGLMERKLVVALTPPGRGQIVTHGMYLDREWDKVRQAAASGVSEPATSAPAPSSGELERLSARVAALEAEVQELRERLAALEA